MADDIVQVTKALQLYHNGVPVSIRRHDLYRADDPVVKAHGYAFGPPEVKRSPLAVEADAEAATASKSKPAGGGSSTAGDTETADAVPGTRRTTTGRATTGRKDGA